MSYLRRILVFLAGLLIFDLAVSILFQKFSGVSVSLFDSIKTGISNIPFFGEFSELVDHFINSSANGTINAIDLKMKFSSGAGEIFKFSLVTIIAFPITRVTGLVFNRKKLWPDARSEGMFASVKRNILGFILSVNSIYVSTFFAVAIMKLFDLTFEKVKDNLFSIPNLIAMGGFVFSVLFVVLAHSLLITAFMSLAVGKVIRMITETILFESINNAIVILLLALITKVIKSPDLVSTLVLLIIPFIGILLMLDLLRNKVISRVL